MLDEMSLYESLCAVSEKMLKEAEDEEWENVVALEQQHYEMYFCLKEMNDRQPLAAKSSDRKAELINRILRVSRRTQALIKQRIDKLQKGGAEERKIMQAYGAQTV